MKTAAQKYARIQAYFFNAVFVSFAYCVRAFGFGFCRLFRVSVFVRCIERCSGVVRSACMSEYSGFGVRRSAFSPQSTLVAVRGTRFAFVCGVPALVKLVGRVSQRGSCNALTTAQQGAAPDRLQSAPFARASLRLLPSGGG